MRGLDYYTRTTFEYQAGNLGAQNAVGEGGRYDGLAQVLGWSERFPGIGWALGIDRSVLALSGSAREEPAGRVAAFVVVPDRDLVGEAFALVNQLRKQGVAADLAFGGRSVRAQFKAADRSGAHWAVVLGLEEHGRDEVTLRDLRSGQQRSLPRGDLPEALRD